MKIFGLGASAAYAQQIAAELGVDCAAHEEREFEDTEFKVRPLESVRGEQVFVCCSLYADADLSASDKLCRLLFFIGAVKDAGAARVTAVVPYLAYARKDRRTKSRDPVSLRYVAQMFEAVGCDAIVTADVHNLAAYENAFRCPKDHLSMAALFVDHFRSMVEGSERTVVVSPDAGGMKRAKAFIALLAERTGQAIGLGFMEKSRSEGRVAGELFGGDVSGATVIVVDDLISGGTTMVRTAAACRERGATSVHAAATHGVFGTGASDKLATAALDSIVVGDTAGDVAARVPGLGSKLVVLPSSGLFARALARHAGRPA